MQNSRDFRCGPVESGDVAVADYARLRTLCDGKVAVAAVLIAALGLLLQLSVTVPAKAVDLDELTVVTMARDGSWGVATAGSQGPAIAAAVHDCRVMAGGPSDCGAQFISMRGGCVIAGLCGSQKIFVTGATLEDAERAAMHMQRERNLNVPQVLNASPCRWVLTVDPTRVVLTATLKNSGPVPTD